MDHIISAVRRRDRVSEIETRHGHKLITESRASDPRQAAGPAPMEMLLAGLAACAAGTFSQVLEKMRLDFDDVRVHVAAQRADQSPKVWAYIHYTIEVHGDIPDDRARRALELTERECPASVMLTKATELTSSVEVVRTS